MHGLIVRVLSALRAEIVASALDLDVEAVGICHACLLFVSFALDAGDELEIRRTVRSFTPDLWAEGLALPARASLERALQGGAADADAAIADIETNGARSRIAEAIVRRLGGDLLEGIHARTPHPAEATVTPLDTRR